MLCTLTIPKTVSTPSVSRAATAASPPVMAVMASLQEFVGSVALGSRGRPRTRSARMLRMISSVPPAIDRPGAEHCTAAHAAAGPSSASQATAAEPTISIASAAESLDTCVPLSLASDPSGPGSTPASRASVTRLPNSAVMRSRMASCEILSAMAESSMRPRRRASAARASAGCPYPAGLLVPIETRSFISVVMAVLHPWPTSPSTAPGSRRQPSKKTSLNLDAPVIWRRGRISMPGRDMSTMNMVIPAWRELPGSDRASSMPKAALWAPEVQTF